MRLRYYGHQRQRTGYGMAARNLLQALDCCAYGPQRSAFPWLDLRNLGRMDHDLPATMEGYERPLADPDVVLVHTLPRDCHRVLELEGLKRGDGPKLIAYSTWEALAAPPEILQPLVESFDQIWVPSTVNAQAFLAELGHTSAHGDPGMIRVLPHCFDEEVTFETVEKTRGAFRFYWVGAWTARKNPGGLIRAFARAFTSRDNVELVMHSPGCSMDTFVATLAATGLEQRELPAITLSNAYLDEDGMASLHHGADCFVTATRGEAWNLPAFDALLHGRHIISQYGLGSDEFLVNTSADLIDGLESPAAVDVKFIESSDGEMRLKTVGATGLTSRSLWLDPNLSSLADAMRSAYESEHRTIEIGYDVAQRFGYAAVANLAMNMLEEM